MTNSTLSTHKGLSPLDARAFSLWAFFFPALSFLLPFLSQIVLKDAFWSAYGPGHNLSFFLRIIKSDLHDVFLYISVFGTAKHVFFEELLRLMLWVICAGLSQSIEERLESSQTSTTIFLFSHELVLQSEVKVSGRFTWYQWRWVLELMSRAQAIIDLDIHPLLWRTCALRLLFANSYFFSLLIILWYYDAVFELERLANIKSPRTFH